MKNTLTTLLLVVLYLHLSAQDHLPEFSELCESDDSLARKELLIKWEQEKPDDPELFTSYFNHYFLMSRQHVLQMGAEPGTGDNLQILDSTDSPVAFMFESKYYDPQLLNKAFEHIDAGIEKFPDRLDMRFGKIHALSLVEDWEGFTQEIIKAIDHWAGKPIAWTWTYDEPLEEPEAYFLDNIQGYNSRIYNTGDDDLLKYMCAISEKILEYRPKSVESLTNISVANILTEDYNKALEYLLPSEEINPQDVIVLNNIAHCYRKLGEKKMAIQYYEKMIEVGDDEDKAFGKQQIDKLKQKN